MSQVSAPGPVSIDRVVEHHGEIADRKVLGPESVALLPGQIGQDPPHGVERELAQQNVVANEPRVVVVDVAVADGGRIEPEGEQADPRRMQPS